MATSSVSSSSSSTISTNLATSSRARVNGTSLVSGLDTDTLIQQLTATTRNKIAKQQQKMQTTSWQRDSYREVTTKMTDFSSKYFSYANSSSTNILNSKFFDVATIVNPSSLFTVSGSTSAAKNMQVGSISQLARQAAFTSTKQVSKEVIQSGLIKQDWVQSAVQAQSMDFTYGKSSYSISLPQNIVLDTVASDAQKMSAMQKAVQAQIDSNADLKGKVTVSLTGNGVAETGGCTTTPPYQFTLTNSDATNALKITGGDLTKSLGFSKDSTGAAITGSTLDSTAVGKLYASKTLPDALAGSSLTFTLNGISKDVSFNLTDKLQYSTIADMRTYVQNALNSAFGAGKVTVGNNNVNNDVGSNGAKAGDITFKTTEPTSVLSVTSSDNTNVLNETGALKIGAGESNRVELSKTLKQLSSAPAGDVQDGLCTEMSSLQANDEGNYVINVNGKDFTFSQDTTLSSVMSQINNDDKANVTIAYSSITNKFNVTAKSSGASSGVNISDVSVVKVPPLTNQSTLAASLFGTAETAIQSSAAISETNLQSNLSGTKMSFTLGGTTKEITFTANTDNTNFKDLASTSAYLQNQLNTEYGTGKITVSTANGGLKFTSTDPKSILTINSDTANSTLNITAGSTITGDYAIKDGQDAKLKMSFDGGNTFTDIDRTENTFTLDGVNFGLLATTDPTKSLTDTTVKFTTNNNVDDLYKKINDFINDYNDVVGLINGKVSEAKEKDPAYDPLSDEQKKQMTDTQITDWNTHAKKGVLQNDGTLNKISSDMRTVMTSIAKSTNLKALSKIGIATSSYDYDTATNGKLIVSETDLKKALTQNADAVADLFTNSTDGIAKQLKGVLDANVGSYGGDGTLIRIAGKATTLADQSTLSKSISGYNTAIKDLKTKLTAEQDKYWTKFTAMETQLSTLQSQSSWLSQQSSGNG